MKMHLLIFLQRKTIQINQSLGKASPKLNQFKLASRKKGERGQWVQNEISMVNSNITKNRVWTNC
jgi:hypothetical protein